MRGGGPGDGTGRRGGDAPGPRRPHRQGRGRGSTGAQKLPWTNGWLSRKSAVGLHFSSTNTCRRKSLQASDTPSGSVGFVGWVAILKMAAMASYSAHGGFWVNISTTVQATLLKENSTTGKMIWMELGLCLLSTLHLQLLCQIPELTLWHERKSKQTYSSIVLFL